MSGSDEEDELYCICRSKDVKRFMIGCDHCEDWFHGDCINVTEKEAKYIKKFYCPECRRKNSELKVVYKSKYLEKYPEKDGKSSLGQSKESSKSHHAKDKPRESNKSGDEQKPRHPPNHPQHKKKSKDKDRDKDKEKEREKRKEKEREREREKRKEKEREERKKEKERERKKEEEKKAKEEEKRALKKEEEKKAAKREEEKKTIKQEEESGPKEEKLAIKAVDSATAMIQDRTPSVEHKPHLKREAPSSDYEEPLPKHHDREKHMKAPPPKKERKDVLMARNLSDESEESASDDWEPPVVVPSSKTKKKEKPASKKKTKAAATPKVRKRKGRRGYYESSSECEPEKIDTRPKQCNEPMCTQTARYGSKYCSDKCGLALATRRIYQTLPDRIREWNLTPCEAEKANRKELEAIHSKQNDVKNRMEQLNMEFKMLEEVISKGKTLSIEENDDDSDEETNETTVHCVTCGALINVNTAIRHMERCYNRIESKTSFASKFKTQIEDHRMFCDFYNPKEETYCKRLQVLCPEHNPDPKVSDEEVCGYPLQKELFGKPHAFCLKPKKTCHQHFCWEKLRRAEIDLSRVKMWMKVDELLEQERQIKSAMASRAGVIGLMLHSTFNHELDGRWQAAQRAAAQQRKVQATQMSKHNQKPVK